MIKILTSILALLLFNSIALAEEAKVKKNPQSFEYTIFVSADSEKVWQYIVTPEHVKNYFLAPMSKIELKKGGDIIYADGMISGKVTDVKPGLLLKHTFKFAHLKDEKESNVEYLLRPLGKVTQITLVHHGFAEEGKTYNDIATGWPVIMSQLKTYIETGKHMPWPKPE